MDGRIREDWTGAGTDIQKAFLKTFLQLISIGTLGRFSISSPSGEVFTRGNVGDQKMPGRILV